MPKITRLLCPIGTDTDSHYSACSVLHKLADRQASRNALARNPQLIENIVRLLQTTQDINIQTEAALALRKLCYAKPAALIVQDYLSLENLVQLLSHPTETILITALSILHKQMLFFPDEVRREVRRCGGPIHLTALLTPEKLTDPTWLAICADAIRMAAYEDQETKLVVLDSGLPTKIVHLLRTFEEKESLHFALARLLKVVSVSTECKQGFVQVGAIQALAQLLSSPHDTLVLEALWGLRNLSDQAFHLTDTRDLFKMLVPLLASSVEHIAICSVGCLCNLTCQNATSKVALIELGGVSALCACMSNFLTRDEVTEPVCSALRNLTHQNDLAPTALQQIQESGIIPKVVDLLSSYTFPAQLPLVKSVIGLIRNLGLHRKCRRDLQQLGVTLRLLALFQKANGVFEDAVNQRGSVLSDSSELSYIEGVRLEDLIELILIALQSMARHSPARMQIIQSQEGGFSSIVPYLYNNSEYLQRAALGLLNEVSVCPEGIEAIEREGAVARITDLVQSGNPKTATYSASILHRISQLKPADYQARLSKELKQSLVDAGIVLASKMRSTDNSPRGRDQEEIDIANLPEAPREPLPGLAIVPNDRKDPRPIYLKLQRHPIQYGNDKRVLLQGREATKII